MKRVLIYVLLALCLLLLIGPFLVPIPPLEGTMPPEALADPDSQFVDIDGVQIHYKAAGQGQPALVLLHGFVASLFSWREVIPPLAQEHQVVAFDRPAFGLTERPLPGEWKGPSPYGSEAQVDQTVRLMDELGIDRGVLVGNSAGGTIAVQVALAHPERVQALVLVDPAIYTGNRERGWLRPLFSLPQVRRLGPLLVRSIRGWGLEFGRLAWHDPSRITPEIWEGYTLPLKADNWDVGLWEFVRARRSQRLDKRLDEIRMPVLVITGDDDQIIPTEQSIRLAANLPNASLVVVPDCGHVPHEECPQAFLEAVGDFLTGLPEE